MLTVYGRPGCPWCDKAKNLVQMLKDQQYFKDAQYINYQELGWDKNDLSKAAGHQIQTVPVVILNGVYIGGYSDLRARYPID